MDVLVLTILDGGIYLTYAVSLYAGANALIVAVGTSLRSDLSSIQKGGQEVKDCFDCEFAEFDVEEYYGGGKQKIVTGCKSPDFCSEQLSVGDFIKCKDRDDMISTMHDLIMEGIESELRYIHNGEKGLWLEVIAVDS